MKIKYSFFFFYTLLPFHQQTSLIPSSLRYTGNLLYFCFPNAAFFINLSSFFLIPSYFSGMSSLKFFVNILSDILNPLVDRLYNSDLPTDLYVAKMTLDFWSCCLHFLRNIEVIALYQDDCFIWSRGSHLGCLCIL